MGQAGSGGNLVAARIDNEKIEEPAGSPLDIDRGMWHYRVVTDDATLSISRRKRHCQDLVDAEVWRGLAALGVNDVSIVQRDGVWLPIVEVGDSDCRWTLAAHEERSKAEEAARHFLETLEECRKRGSGVLPAEVPPVAHMGISSAEGLLEETSGLELDVSASEWELVYSRPRDQR